LHVTTSTFLSLPRSPTTTVTRAFASTRGSPPQHPPTGDLRHHRGTGQPDGVGREGEAFVDSLRSQVGGTSVGVYAVNYPASNDFLRVADGANDASWHIQATATNCPATKIVLGGYSQGAAVIDAITSAATPTLGFTNLMPPEMADHVAAVAVFGNSSNRERRSPRPASDPMPGNPL
jgi:cutinase